MVTLKEIAKKSKTSITTVSRVLNYDKTLSVSDEIRNKVIETASNLNYKTPRNRTKIKSEKKLRICVVHWYDVRSDLDDPYYIQIRRGIENLAYKSKIETISIYRNKDTFDFKQAGQIDGLICIGKFSSAQINLFRKVTTSIVFIDHSPDSNLFDSVVIDTNKAIKSLLQTIIKQGYERIGYIGGVENISKHVKIGERRELFLRDFLFQRNKLNTKYIHVGNFSVESGYRLMVEALSKKDYAEIYFCSNDSIAFGALRAIHEKGLAIPEDISIVGFNDNPNSEYTFPPLSSVKVYAEFMGEQALLSLCERISGRTIAIRKVIPTKLVKRNSF